MHSVVARRAAVGTHKIKNWYRRVYRKMNPVLHSSQVRTRPSVFPRLSSNIRRTAESGLPPAGQQHASAQVNHEERSQENGAHADGARVCRAHMMYRATTALESLPKKLMQSPAAASCPSTTSSLQPTMWYTCQQPATPSPSSPQTRLHARSNVTAVPESRSRSCDATPTIAASPPHGAS